MRKINVAIDGPSGAGKSSIAKEVARQSGLKHLDTGKMYRALSLALNQAGISPDQPEQIDQALLSLDLDVKDGRVFINGEDVTDQLMDDHLSSLTSRFASNPSVRKKLVAEQQKITASKGYILDGRDICDVVLPDAEVKLYIDASAEQRAKRRLEQNQQLGDYSQSYEEVLARIEERDKNDREREVSPLRQSKDAIYLDNGELSFAQSVEEILSLIRKAQMEV